MTDILFSIVIPVRHTTKYLEETLSKLKSQSFKSFEVIVVTDKDIPDPSNSTQIGPAYKRNLGASRARGQYLAFLDDDSYPDIDWLKNSKTVFEKHSTLAGLCGPCLTPPEDNIFKQASGLVWSSFIGSGGAGAYRNSIAAARYVDDYPSVNLIICKTSFDKIGGFVTDFWPGEDTLLCRDITQKLNQKILYHPEIIVYHHRRDVLIPHLQQITRYALHRGLFARLYPENSRKLGYFIPSLFLIYNLFLLLISFTRNSLFLFAFLPDLLYIFLVLLNAIYLIIKGQKPAPILLFIIAVPATHLYYGFLFIRGFFSAKLNLKPHLVNQQTGQYLGG